MKNALICFMKFPEPGKVKTRLAEDLGPKNASDFYEAMVERILTQIYPLNDQYEIRLFIDPGKSQAAYEAWLGGTWSFTLQQGNDLGTRMSVAFTQTFESGFDRVCIIGTDCLDIDETQIDQVFTLLDNKDMVVGPSSDGGYYLLAMKQPAAWLFENMPWSTDRVLKETLDRLDGRGLTYFALEEKLDVDNMEDLTKLRTLLPKEHFLAKKIDSMVLEVLRDDIAEDMMGQGESLQDINEEE